LCLGIEAPGVSVPPGDRREGRRRTRRRTRRTLVSTVEA